MTTVNRSNAQPQDGLWQGPLIGGFIGALFQQPLLGALGGLAYKLLSTEGMADSAKKLVGEFTGSDDALGSLGKWLGGTSQPANGEKPAEAQGTRAPGMPTWAKWGIGIAAAAVGLNFVQDNLVNTFFGMPNYGFGMMNMMPYGNMWNPNMPLWGGGWGGGGWGAGWGGGGFFPYW